MIAVDTNLLVHAHRRDSPFHGSARDCLAELSERAPSWSIPWPCLHEFLVGPAVHDVRIAALCLANGVSELWTADRDFGRFPALKVRNPLVQT